MFNRSYRLQLDSQSDGRFSSRFSGKSTDLFHPNGHQGCTRRSSRSLNIWLLGLLLSGGLSGGLSGCLNSEAAKLKAYQHLTSTPESTPTAPSLGNPARPDAAVFAQADRPFSITPSQPNTYTSQSIQRYLKTLQTQGYAPTAQGIWIQTGNTLLANHQGTKPLPAASLTKVATSLAALQTLGVNHRFLTIVGTTGPIVNGIVKGDLVIQGGGDPLFVWEDGIALGNLLNQMNIQRVSGDLVILGRFSINFEPNPARSGALLKQALHHKTWSSEILTQYQTLPANTRKPQVTILGKVKIRRTPVQKIRTLVRHQSLPLAELLKQMNRYSNNPMAEAIAQAVGGAPAVARQAARSAGVPVAEIQLVNGSGLSIKNRISPRAVCALFQAIDRYLQTEQMTIGDIFTIVGQDTGVLDQRALPRFAVTKSGSLDAVSALAGALPTQKGVVWFVVINGGGNNLEGFRRQQEGLLNTLTQQWGAVSAAPPQLSASQTRRGLSAMVEALN